MEEGRTTLRYVCIECEKTATRDVRAILKPVCPSCRKEMQAVPPEKLLRSPKEWKKKGLFKN